MQLGLNHVDQQFQSDLGRNANITIVLMGVVPRRCK